MPPSSPSSTEFAPKDRGDGSINTSTTLMHATCFTDWCRWWGVRIAQQDTHEEELCLCPKAASHGDYKHHRNHTQHYSTTNAVTTETECPLSRVEWLERCGRYTLQFVLVTLLVTLSWCALRIQLDRAHNARSLSRLHRAAPKVLTANQQLHSVFHRVKGHTPAALSELVSAGNRQSSRELELERMLDIYCRGPLLHAVQMANAFPDSKHFVDMPIKVNSSAFEILVDFQQRELAMTDYRPSVHHMHDVQLRRFLEDHFDPPGSDLLPITPLDYQESLLPPLMAHIRDLELREWAFELHHLWQNLGRVPNPNAKSSLLRPRELEASGVDRPENVLIVPGGRFRESYYWDSYWIVQGLLVSDMPVTARGVVNHLLEFVAEFGFVPNGGRVYYLTRSQPPMLSDMVKLVANVPGNASQVEYDKEYLNVTVPILEREYDFWMQRGPCGHAVELTRPDANDEASEPVAYVLNRYTSNANRPRPESYREDVLVAGEIFDRTIHMDNGNAAATEAQKDKYYNDVIAAAESGWDFSSRWLRDPLDMKSMLTSAVVPVDLNAILYRMERNLMDFHAYLNNHERAEVFKGAAARRLEAMNRILWSEEHQTWKDYDLETDTHSRVVSVSDYTPLWAKAFDPEDKERLRNVVTSLERSGLLQVGGVQTTTLLTGQQWDSPNAWPPEQDIIVEGLLAANTAESHGLARSLARTWTQAGLAAWKLTGLMYEKYNASEVGGLGVGGEYFPQFGFGWTNGVILKFLTIHQNLLLTD